MDSYNINPATVRAALSNVTTDREDIAPKREAMFEKMEDLMEAAKMRAVSTALSSVWNDLIALQAEAAETRIENAVNGMEGSVQAFEQGDMSMMESAQATMRQSPELEIDDAIVVEA
jgi:hypothetical protein